MSVSEDEHIVNLMWWVLDNLKLTSLLSLHRTWSGTIGLTILPFSPSFKKEHGT